MKLLNESNLVYFSTCSSQTTKEGWLYKKGEVNRSFQKRWFALKGNLLFYFDKPGDREPNGVIILEGYTVELVDTAYEGHTFQISFRGAGNLRKYILQAESHIVMEQWMKAITCASYDYMKLMVSELKAQLDELNSQELSSELSRCKTRADGLDPFDQPPFVPQVPHVERIDLEGSGESTGSNNSTTSDGSQALSRPRINPFDRNNKKDAFNMDPFGQVPFRPESAATRPASEPSLTVPQVSGWKKIKNSPKLKHKVNIAKHSPKTSRKAIGDDACKPVQGRTQFYQDARLYYGDEHKPPYRQSCFNDLHSKYGEIINRVINSFQNHQQETTIKSCEEGSDVLIHF